MAEVIVLRMESIVLSESAASNGGPSLYAPGRLDAQVARKFRGKNGLAFHAAQGERMKPLSRTLAIVIVATTSIFLSDPQLLVGDPPPSPAVQSPWKEGKHPTINTIDG